MSEMRSWSREAVASARQRLRERPAPNVPAPPEDWRFHDAAAVLSSFEIRPTLHPIGRDAAADNAALARLIQDSVCTADVDGRRRYVLKSEPRKQALARLESWERIQVALDTNTTRPEDPLQQVFQDIVAGKLKPHHELTLEELIATLQVLEWLPPPLRLSRNDLPLPEDVRRRIDLETLRQPFTALATENFRGRKSELAVLRDYVGLLEPSSLLTRISRGVRELTDTHERRPLVVHAPGGTGKSTVIARFILEHTSNASPKLPFIYLDCDRPGLVPDQPLTLLLEGVRQLGVQFPHFAPAARDWIARWQNVRGDVDSDVYESQLARPTALQREELLGSCRVFIDDLELGNMPLLLVIDTFEEVQYRGRAYVSEVWRLLSQLQRLLPRLRTIVASRAKVDQPCEELSLGNLDDAAAVSFLEASGITDPAVAKAVARQMRGNPLSLRLAAQVLRFEVPDRERVRDLDAGGMLRRKVDDARIQGELFRRILSHVARDDVRKLAHPGLVLRRITPALIQQVLAGPCDVDVQSTQQANELFEALRREVSLVTGTATDGEVRHRPEVRRVMLDLLRAASPDAVRQIERNAVAYYEAAGKDVSSRAEEIYHRLGLGQDAATIRTRWLPGVEDHLHGAIEDFSGAAQVLLASLLDVDLYDVRNEALSDDSWPQAAEKQARDLLRLGRADEALDVLRSRRLNNPTPALRSLEARVLAQLGRMREARLLALDSVSHAIDVPQPQDLELHRIIAEADDILESEPSEPDPVGRYHSLAKAMPLNPEVLELGSQWCRVLRRWVERTGEAAPAIESLQAAMDDSLQAMPDEVLREVPQLLRQLRADQLIASPGQLQRVGELLRADAERNRNEATREQGSVKEFVQSHLDRQRRAQLVEALASEFPTNSELEALVRTADGPGLAAIVSLNVDVRTSTMQVVRWAESLGQVGNLVSAALTLRPESTLLRAAEAALDVIRYASNSSAAETLLVDGPRPFVGRNVLRKFVASIGQHGAPRVLIVNGPAGTGKSYSTALMSYVAQTSMQYEFRSVQARRLTSPADLALDIARQGGWAPHQPLESAIPERTIEELVQWIMVHAGRRRKPLLMAIDDLGDELPEVTMNFVVRLAHRVVSSSQSTLNLALLGFPSDRIPAIDRRHVMFEVLSAIAPADMEQFIVALSQFSLKDVPDIATARTWARATVDALRGVDQKQVNETLVDVVRQLLR